jgi:hypothetical protein
MGGGFEMPEFLDISISSILSSGQDHRDFDNLKSLLSVFWLAPALDAVNDNYKPINII